MRIFQTYLRVILITSAFISFSRYFYNDISISLKLFSFARLLGIAENQELRVSVELVA